MSTINSCTAVVPYNPQSGVDAKSTQSSKTAEVGVAALSPIAEKFAKDLMDVVDNNKYIIRFFNTAMPLTLKVNLAALQSKTFEGKLEHIELQARQASIIPFALNQIFSWARNQQVAYLLTDSDVKMMTEAFKAFPDIPGTKNYEFSEDKMKQCLFTDACKLYQTTAEAAKLEVFFRKYSVTYPGINKKFPLALSTHNRLAIMQIIKVRDVVTYFLEGREKSSTWSIKDVNGLLAELYPFLTPEKAANFQAKDIPALVKMREIFSDTWKDAPHLLMGNHRYINNLMHKLDLTIRLTPQDL